jgi:glycosyltransferase involved in cell wall biosynthesis
MKNLLFALKVLRTVSGEVTFDIYGPLENKEYWNECEKVIGTMPHNIRVRYMGSLEHQRVLDVFAKNDLFFLPTLGENYGHVICEALSAGCPVLISDQTPWRDLHEKGVGWDIPLTDAETFRAVLQQCVDSAEDCYSELVIRASEYACKALSDPAIVEENRTLFRYATAASLQV